MNTSGEQDISAFVQGHVLEQAAGQLATEFATARPFRHIVMDNFLAADFCDLLVAQFPAFDEKLAINENGEVGAKAVHEQIAGIGSAYADLDALSRSTAFRKLIGTITGINDLHHDPHYFGGGTHENLQGQGLDAHVDFNYHPITGEHRRLNLIVYLNPEWEDQWGGSLQLHRDPYLVPSQDEIKVVTPLLNRCVIFETNEISWHGFKRIVLPRDKQHISRRSFALYYYTADRPAEETAAEHSTIYVEEHLPETYHAGMELSGEQLQHIKNLLVSRDTHLRRLYENIKGLNAQIHHLRGQLGQAHAEPVEVVPELPVDTDTEERMAQIQRQLNQALYRVRELEQSTSWRVTAPLRALRRAFRSKDS